MDAIRAVRAGDPVPLRRIVQLRSMGLRAIRFEFVVREPVCRQAPG